MVHPIHVQALAAYNPFSTNDPIMDKPGSWFLQKNKIYKKFVKFNI